MNRILRAALAVAALAIGVAVWPKAWAPIWGTWWERALLVGIAWAFVASGLAAWSRRPDNSIGRAMTLVGFLFFFPTLQGVRVPVIWTIASPLETVWIPVVLFALLAFPEGRVRVRFDRWVIGLATLWFVGSLWGTLFYQPALAGCGDCPANLNLLVIRHDLELVDSLHRHAAWALISVLAATFAILARRFVGATVAGRRVLIPMSAPAAVFLLAYLAYLVFQQTARHALFDAPEDAYRALSTALLGGLLLLPITFLLGLSRYRARRARVSDLVVELGSIRAPQRLRDALARTLGDPTLQVGLWLPGSGGYVSTEGARVEIPEADPIRTASYLESNGQPLAVIVHDTALLDDPGLVDAVAAAARLAVENDQLQAAVRTQLEEVRASRLRIVEAADEERRRIERNLHDGAQARLLSLSLALRVAESKLDESGDDELRRSLSEVGEELRAALAELRELARGIHPAVLVNDGLAAAIEALAERAPVPMVLEELPSERIPASVEAAAYYVVSEAVTNAAKHSTANVVSVRVIRERTRLVVEVADDGIGGASLDAGQGLRGLADRVHALDGEFEIKSPAGSGTRIVASIPCA